MATLDTVGNTLVLATTYPGTKVDISIQGTYVMKILFQTEVGSPGSGAWQTLRTYNTEDETVAESYYTERWHERVRLIVDVDTSGSATALLTDVTTTQLHTQRGPLGQELYTIYEDGAMVPRATPVVLTAAIDLERDKHAFRKLFLSAAAGFKVRMPKATGSGDEYHFYVVTKTTSNAYELNAFELGNDDVNGVIVGVDPPGDEFTWGAQGTENMVVLGGSSNATGGFVGDYVRFVDIKSGMWAISGHITQDGTEATPFGTDS